MKTEKDFKEGEVVIYSNKDETHDFTGVVNYSEGEEIEGCIRVRQVFTETPDTGNILHVPIQHIYESKTED